MNNLSYLQEKNIYIVPIMRNRLVFAALVQTALRQISEELPWSGHYDVICISLPQSLRQTLLGELPQLPKARQILANDSASTAREVFAITPGDAFVEAIRSADDMATHVEFVDAEILPGNITQNPCERFPDWLDDSLIDVVGIEKYFESVRGLLTQKPLRSEPVDTWREAYVLQRLRDLQPLWRRIVFVCDMSLVANLRAALREEYRGHTAMPQQGCPSSFVVQDNRTLTVLLNILDDYPRLVELFDKARGPDSSKFDKREVLIEEIQNYLLSLKDITVSTRQIEIFSTFLNNLMLIRRRRCPEPRSLFQVVEACFGRALAERLHCHLASYGDQIKVERVRPRRLDDIGSFEYTLDVRSSKQGYRARECIPFVPSYDITPPIRVDPNPNDSEGNEFKWTPTFGFLRSVHREVLNIASSVRQEPAVRLFSGSLESGIETRKTLRSFYTRQPALYVKGFGRRREVLDAENEPTLWVLDIDFDRPNWAVQSAHFRAQADDARVEGQQPGESFYISDQEIIEMPDDIEDITLHKEPQERVSILGARRLGWLTFGFQYNSEDQARAAYGSSFEKRVPNHEEFDHPLDHGCIHRVFTDDVRGGDISWLALAVLTAFKYAERVVVVVIPSGLTIPHVLLQEEVCRGKEALYIPLEKFSQQERDKLRTDYRMLDKGKRKKTQEYYAALMRRFWI